jgi:hypothetical protein
MFENQSMDSLDLGATKPNAALQPNRVEPELCQVVLPLDVHMRRLFAFARETALAALASPRLTQFRSNGLAFSRGGP